MIQSTKFSDAVLVADDGTRFPAHRLLLVARSPVLAQVSLCFSAAFYKCIQGTHCCEEVLHETISVKPHVWPMLVHALPVLEEPYMVVLYLLYLGYGICSVVTEITDRRYILSDRIIS